jgi:hypothetical protein
MLDTTEWNIYYKLDPQDRIRCPNNNMYTPYISPDGKIMCMHWNKDSEYQKLDGLNRILTDKLMDFFFEREVRYLKLFKNYAWCPEVLFIDHTNKKIFIEWNNETCNDLIYGTGDLDKQFPDWQEQLYGIINDIVKSGHYKTSLYPHCFFFDNNGRLKTFDMYACAHKDDPYISFEQIDGMMGKESMASGRFKEATEGNLLNLGKFFKRALAEHVIWPHNALQRIYERVLFNWNDVITSLEDQEGTSITADPSKWNLDTPGYTDIYKMWKDANFNPNAIKWINFYPEKNYPKEIVEELAQGLNIRVLRSWISKIDPGYFAPWHWDVDDNEEEYLQGGEIVRYSCFIEPPAMGHVFIINNDYYFNVPQGKLVKWNNYKDWHCGINGGLTPKYMLHVLGNPL